MAPASKPAHRPTTRMWLLLPRDDHRHRGHHSLGSAAGCSAWPSGLYEPMIQLFTPPAHLAAATYISHSL